MEASNSICEFPEWIRTVILAEAIAFNLLILTAIVTAITLKVIIWKAKRGLSRSENFKEFLKKQGTKK